MKLAWSLRAFFQVSHKHGRLQRRKHRREKSNRNSLHQLTSWRRSSWLSHFFKTTTAATSVTAATRRHHRLPTQSSVSPPLGVAGGVDQEHAGLVGHPWTEEEQQSAQHDATLGRSREAGQRQTQPLRSIPVIQEIMEEVRDLLLVFSYFTEFLGIV